MSDSLVPLEDGHSLNALPGSDLYTVHNPENLPAGSYFVSHLEGAINGVSRSFQQAVDAVTGVTWSRVFSQTGWSTWVESVTTGTTVSAPEFSVGSGDVEEGTTVTLTSATPGAAIYYTDDGSDPDSGDTPYTVPIEITDDTTIKAIAIREGINSSPIVTRVYTIFVTATPEFSLEAGEVEENAELVLTSATPGASIYYTDDDSDPDSGDTLYENPIVITAGVTIKAIAVRANYKDSAIASATYTVDV